MELNNDLLQKTIKEIEDMYFWKEDISLNSNDYEIIHDFDKAYENAFEEFFVYVDDEEYSWGDILENNMRLVWKKVFNEENYQEYNKQINKIKIPDIHVEEGMDDSVYSEISYELLLCAKARFVCGYTNIFFEKLFKVYKTGGWPCGWNNGKIIVYVPKS